MEWVVAIQDKKNGWQIAQHMNMIFPYKSTAEWFCILTQIKYAKEMKKDEYRRNGTNA